MIANDELGELLTLAEVQEQYGVKRATLYRSIQRGQLKTYRRGLDRRAYVRRADLEDLQRFRTLPPSGLTMAAVERAREFQRRVFGDRVLTPSSAELIEQDRLERTEALP